MFGKLFTSVGLGWLGRRAMDWGGWLAGLGFLAYDVYSRLTPSDQAAVVNAIQQIFTGRWKEMTLGSVVGLAMLVFSQFRSYKATVKPAVVTSDGTKGSLDAMAPTTRQTIETVARNAAEVRPRRPLVDLLKGIFGKN